MQEMTKDNDIIKKLDQLFKESKGYRDQFESGWIEDEKFYAGEQWKSGSKRPVKNWVFNTIETEVPILTDSRPGSDIISLTEEGEDGAKILESALHYTYDQQCLSLKITETVREALISGTGWLYTDWDPDLEGGQGQVVIKVLSWRFVYLDQAATEINDAFYAKIRMPIRIDELKRRFPHKAKEIVAVKLDDVFGDNVSDYVDETRWDAGSGLFVKKQYDTETMTVLDEDWIRDYTLVKIPEIETLEEIAKEAEQFMTAEIPDVGKYEDHEQHIIAHEELKVHLVAEALQIPIEEVTEDDMEALKQDEQIGLTFILIDDHIEAHNVLKEQNPKGQKPKFDGNVRLVMRSGKTVLYDGPPPVDNEMFTTLTSVYCYKTAKSIFGMGEVAQIKDAQKSYNDMDWAEYQGLRLTSNSGWLVDEESGVDETTLTNEPGIVVKKKVGTEVQRLQAGQVSPQLSMRKDRDREAVEAISGITDMTQGAAPSGVVAERAIRSIREQSIGRIRLKSRYLEEYSMIRLGKIVTSYIIKFWTTERKLRVYDKNGELQFIDFSPAAVEGLKYDIRVAPGTTAGIDKESILAVMKELLVGQVIDPKTFFKYTDLPHSNEILKQMEENDEQAAMLEQLMVENEQMKAQLGIPSEMPQQ